MDQDRVARLSEGQRQCLRLVYRHMESKEIARELGISPDGATQRIKTAMRILGVDRRRDAAQILAEAEGLGPYPPLVYPPRDIATAPDPVMLGPSTGGERQQLGEPSGGAMNEEQTAFMVATPFQEPRLPFPIGGARPNDVGWLKRLAWIAAITIGVALAFGALVSGVDTLAKLIRG